MNHQWQRAALVLALAMGVAVGTVHGHITALHAAVPAGDLNRQLFDAIYKQLSQAHLPSRDLPKRILTVRPMGDRRYAVHCEMGEGQAWFEVSWQGGQWQVRGLNQPPGQ